MDGISRRTVIRSGVALALLPVGARGEVPALQSLPFLPTVRQPLAPGCPIAAAATHGDLIFSVPDALTPQVSMQTNGVLLRLDLVDAVSSFDPSRIAIKVADRGHDSDGNIIDRFRTITVRCSLVGPIGLQQLTAAVTPRLLLVLAEPIFNQSAEWQTRILSLDLAAGWCPGGAAFSLPGSCIERLDTLPYPPFPVKPLTPPFQRIAPGEPLAFEVSGMNEFGQNGGMFARVEAWLHVAGQNGPLVATDTMVVSNLTGGGAPSGLPAPAYVLPIAACPDLAEGVGEIRYRVLPFIGPPWSSEANGVPFPTLSAPVGVPVCHDLSDSWRPLYGIVAQDGVGLAGTDTRGLGLGIEAAWQTGLRYRDCAAVAAAVRLVNKSPVPMAIAGGGYRRMRPHDDNAGGVAVLPPVAGSTSGSPFGAYLLRTTTTTAAASPSGATPFEIRSLSGLPDPSVRLRGANPDGSNHVAKALPFRTVLRGLWIDGIGAAGSAHTVFDGGSAGAPTTRAAAAQGRCLISIDTVFAENPDSSAAAPIRTRCGYFWDIRVRQEGASNVASLGVSSAYAGLVASVGSSYQARTATRMSLTTMAGCRVTNIAVRDADATILENPTGRLALNLRIDFTNGMSSPALMLAGALPSVGGAGLGNVFIRVRGSASGPAIQLGADSALFTIDNIIVRHFGSDVPTSSKLTDGRANLIYQAQGYVRIDKVATVSFSAFHCFTTKGDTFPAPETPNKASVSWQDNRSYPQGQIVHNTIGAATADSVFYQALRPVPAGISRYDVRYWLRAGTQFNVAYGARPDRQGSARFRYQVGCRGNVAASSYNSTTANPALPGVTSGYGYAWAPDSSCGASYGSFYIDRLNNDYRPNPLGPLMNRVPAGLACLPFDLAGVPRRTDGRGAAGAYEAASG